jgi:O-methyltransferase
MSELAKSFLRRYYPTVLYRRPYSMLEPERLYVYLDALWKRRDVPGVVLEVGCWLGGTSAIAARMIRQAGFPRRYIAVDTFSGFVESQLDNDLRHGTPAGHSRYFRKNSVATVRQLLNAWGAAEVELVQGDIATMPDLSLPDQVAVCLLDVDLEIPVYEGLRRIVPRLAPGGVVLVDDCDEDTTWAGARAGYSRFVSDTGVTEDYFLGMGRVFAPA